MNKKVLALLLGITAVAVPVAAFAAAGPPRVSTSPADPTVLQDTYAVISGVVNPNGANTNYWFQYGTTTAYGQTTPVTSASNGTADVPVDASLDGLTASTTYHYRIAAQPATSTDPATVVYGADQAFQTSPALKLGVAFGKIPVKAKHAQLAVHCIGPVDDTCQGRLNLKGLVNKHAVGLGSGGYTVDVGKAKTVSVYLTPAAQKALKASRSHRLHATVTTKPAGTKVVTSHSIVLAG